MVAALNVSSFSRVSFAARDVVANSRPKAPEFRAQARSIRASTRAPGARTRSHTNAPTAAVTTHIPMSSTKLTVAKLDIPHGLSAVKGLN